MRSTAFTKGMNILHGSTDVMSHLSWAMAALPTEHLHVGKLRD
jgi:hypothetical protein